MKKIMKTTMRTMLCMMIIFTMMCLSGCGDSEKQQEAIDTFNEVSTIFDDTADPMRNIR